MFVTFFYQFGIEFLKNKMNDQTTLFYFCFICVAALARIDCTIDFKTGNLKKLGTLASTCCNDTTNLFEIFEIYCVEDLLPATDILLDIMLYQNQ